MRFCTSRSLNTSTTSTRFSDSGTNSICVIGAPARARQRHDAGQLRDAREQLRGGGDQRPWSCRGRPRAGGGSRRAGGLVQRAHLQQRVDEEAVALVGGDAPGGGVRGGDEARVLQVRHDVADGGRGQLQPGLARQRARADRLAVADIALDEDPQQVLRPLTQGLFPSFLPHRSFACAWRLSIMHQWRHASSGAPAAGPAPGHAGKDVTYAIGPSAGRVLQRRASQCGRG